jgi:hypothetical protein
MRTLFCGVRVSQSLVFRVDTGYGVAIIGLDSQEADNEQFADAKGVSRSYHSNKGRQCDEKLIKEKTNGLQNTTRKVQILWSTTRSSAC